MHNPSESDIERMVFGCTAAERASIFRAVCVAATIDGEIRSQEKTLLEKIQEQLKVSNSKAEKTRLQIQLDGVETSTKKCSVPKSNAARGLMLHFVREIVQVDREISTQEKEYLAELETVLMAESGELKQRFKLEPPPSISENSGEEAEDEKSQNRSPLAGLINQLLTGGANGGGSEDVPTEMLGNDEASKRDLATLHSALHSFGVVGLSYAVTAISLGWDLGSFGGKFEGAGFSGGLLLAVVGMVFTFSHGFVVGSIGIMLFGAISNRDDSNSNDSKGSKSKNNSKNNKSKTKSEGGEIIVAGFVTLWFGFWFFGPVLFLAYMTAGISLSWFFLHLALTPPGKRMLAYVEHGSTSLALCFACMVAATGNWLATGILLFGQSCMLIGMEQLGRSDKKSRFKEGITLESIGLRLDRGWKSGFDVASRVVFLTLSVAFVVIHFFAADNFLARDRVADQNESSKVKKEKKKDEPLKRIGGRVTGADKTYGEVVSLSRQRGFGKNLQVLRRYRAFGSLRFGRSNFSDVDLSFLSNARVIHELDLRQTKVTDRGLSALSNLQSLHTLNLSHTRVTDGLLSKLNLSQTRRLDLSGTEVVGPGLKFLSRCKYLEIVNLESTRLFDDDLIYLRDLAKLNREIAIRVAGTRITHHAAKKLEESSMLNFVFSTNGRSTSPEANQDNSVVLPLYLSEPVAINDHYWVVGTKKSRRTGGLQKSEAMIVLPQVMDGDGRPDSYLRDQDQDGEDDQSIDLGVLPNSRGDMFVTDINNKGQIIGYCRQVWKKTGRTVAYRERAFLINPSDTNGDGIPDLWFSGTGSQPRANGLMIELGTLGGMRCRPVSINDSGTITGISYDENDRLHGFVLEPQVGKNGKGATWFLRGAAPRLNRLMQSIVGSTRGPLMIPKHIDEQGRIVGTTTKPGCGGFYLNPVNESPSDTKESIVAIKTWYVDSNRDGRNDLLRTFPDANFQLKNRAPDLSGICFTSDHQRMITWSRKDVADKPECREWRMNSAGQYESHPSMLRIPAGPLPPSTFLKLGLIDGRRWRNRSGAILDKQGFPAYPASVTLPPVE